MQVLTQQEIEQVSGGALDPALGLFPRTGITILDNIHAKEWNTYGKYLYAGGVAGLGLLNKPSTTPTN